MLALIIAVALIAIQAQVAFAAEIVDEGKGIINYVDITTLVDVEVPTSTSLGFTLDPQNLAAIQGVGEWNPEDGGSIIPHAVGIFVNRSAVPIKASAKFTLVDDAEEGVVLLESDADVNEGTDKNMYLSFVPASAKTSITQSLIPAITEPVYLMDGQDPAVFTEEQLIAAGVAAQDMLTTPEAVTADFGQYVETGEEEGEYYQVEVPVHGDIPATVQTTVTEYAALGVEAAASVMADAENGASLAYVMGKADYYVVKDSDGFSLKLDDAARNDNFDTASFIISGLINKNADWSGYDENTEITLSAVYTFNTITDTAYAEAIAGKIEGTYNSIAVDIAPEEPEDEEPSITQTTYTYTPGSPLVVDVSLGTGDLAATGISKITYLNSQSATTTLAANNYTFADSKITFLASYTTSMNSAGVTTRDFTIEFDDTAKTTVTITVNKAN
jgi:hypothetical protein